MKLCIYQRPYKPVALESFKDFLMFVSKDSEVVVDTVYDFDVLLDKVSNGEYAAIFAKHPEDYSSNTMEYHQLMHEAIESKTKVFETNSFSELTASFVKEKKDMLNGIHIDSIQSYIQRKSDAEGNKK